MSVVFVFSISCTSTMIKIVVKFEQLARDDLESVKVVFFLEMIIWSTINKIIVVSLGGRQSDFKECRPGFGIGGLGNVFFFYASLSFFG